MISLLQLGSYLMETLRGASARWMRLAQSAVRPARARRIRAAISSRCRKSHSDSAIRLPPGRSNSIAAYGPNERVRVARRAIQLDCAVVTTCLLAFSSFTGGNSGRWPWQKELTNRMQVLYIFV